MGQGVAHGSFESALQLGIARGRNVAGHQALRHVEQDAIGLGIREAAEAAAKRRLGGPRHARQFERQGIGHGRVAIHTGKKGRVIARHGIQIAASGPSLAGPLRLVPMSA